MRVDRNSHKTINTKFFNKLFKQWWKTNCSEALVEDAEEKFRELFIAKGGDAGITSRTTIHSWRFRYPAPALSEHSLNAIEEIFRVSVAETTTEEKTMTNTPKALTVDAQMAIEFYSLLAHFISRIDFDVNLEDVEISYADLQLELECRSPFISPDLRVLLEKAMTEIAYPLTESSTYEVMYTTPGVGHDTPAGFHVDNLPLLIKTCEEIMDPFRELLRGLAEDIKSML